MQVKGLQKAPESEIRASHSGKVICSVDLFEGKKEIVIAHCNHFYRLMITKSGKLILNK